jgi:hypothetical protein
MPINDVAAILCSVCGQPISHKEPLSSQMGIIAHAVCYDGWENERQRAVRATAERAVAKSKAREAGKLKRKSKTTRTAE